jgi:hypothetical protein
MAVSAVSLIVAEALLNPVHKHPPTNKRTYELQPRVLGKDNSQVVRCEDR